MNFELELFDLQLALEDYSVERIRGMGQKIRPLTNEANRGPFACAVLAALADSPVLSETECLDRFVAFTAALGMEPSEVVSVVQQWNEASRPPESEKGGNSGAHHD